MTATPTILAIDTATQTLSVALSTPQGILLSVEEARNSHTERILDLIDQLLNKAGCSKDSLDAIAFGAGPGAFTGLRVACGVAQGLAWGLGKPLIAVGNLEAAGHAYAMEGKILVALDARMHECYTAVFQTGTEGILETLSEPALCSPENLESLRAKTGADTVLGSGIEAYPESVQTLAKDIRIIHDFQVDARAILGLALLDFCEGKTIDPKCAAPIYVRNRVALTIAERRALKA